jgi:hypothetical protein
MKATAAMKATSMKMATTFILVPFVNKLRALRLVELEASGKL